MKKTKYFLFIVCLLVISANTGSGFAQNTGKTWLANIEYTKLFIENKGQFPYMLNAKTNKEGILFAVDQGPVKIYFTKKGVTFNYIKAKAKPRPGVDAKPSTPEEWAESDVKIGKRRQYKQDEVSFTWDNANPNAEVIAVDPGSEYFSCSFKENGVNKDVNYIKGYKKIIYKNLYPNIDVEYTFHATDGIKYTLILHPGADVSKFKMNYSKPVTISENGDVHIPTLFGDIIDHAPETFYTANPALPVTSKFTLTGNTVGFFLGSYDNMKSVTIDPWVVSPAFTTSTAVWEVETDASGNVYVIGGETPMQLKKYDISGTPGWTYTTPWDTSTVWLGTLATDDLGNSYITSGTTPEIKKITAAGGVAWSNSGNNASCEYWSITFNCDKTKLIVGGTYVPFIISFDFSSAIYDIDITNGSVLNFVTFDTVNIGGIGVFPIEVRSISSSHNAKYIFLTHKNVGAINQNIGACPSDAPVYELDNGHNLSYKCENYLPQSQNGGGLKALVANDQYFYTHSGNQIHRRSLSNGALINSVSIPGGVSATDIFGDLYVSNSGLAVDNCGNVYAGSTNQVVKYDASLNILAQAPLTFCVYDVSVNTNGEVVAVGAQQDNQSVNRNGRIQAVNMTACAQYALVCCDANICLPDTVCSTDPAFNLTASTPGGTWSGTGITNTSLGTFNPTVAGPGQHWVEYTLPCGSDSVLVVVNLCATLNVCQELNGTMTVSGGTGPYTWEEWVPAASTPITNQAECLACGYTWFIGTCLDGMIPVTTCNTPAHWAAFATGTNVTPTGNWPVRVTDNFGNTVTINSLVSLPSCSSCPVSASASPTTICSGQSSNLTGSGATTYAWNPGGLSGTTVTVSPTTTTTYTVTGTAGACTATATVTVTVNTSPTVGATASPATICSGGSTDLTGSGATTYSWNPGGLSGTTVTVSPTTTTTYTVTGTTGSCTGTATVTVTVSSSLSVTASASPATICTGGSTDLTGSGATTYSWNPGGLSGTTVTVSPTTTTTYTVTGTSGGCTGTGTVTVTVSSSLVVSATAAPPAVCTGSSTALTGSGATTYSWNPGGLSGTMVNVSPTTTTTYSVTGTSGGCTGTGTITVTVNPLPTVTTNSTSATCMMNNGSATVTPSGTGPFTYVWNTSPAQTGATANNIPSGNYVVTVTDANGCSKTAGVFVPSTGGPTASVSPTSAMVMLGDTIQLTATASGGGPFTYQWSPASGLSCTNCQNPLAIPTSNTIYCVMVTDTNNCSDTACVTVYIDLLCGEVFVPTAFSPNDDGKNDVFYVRGNCITTMTFAIYDRWGEKVFESKDPLIGWDGKFHKKLCNTGVFVWYLYATLHDGTEVTKKGNLTLFR